jgi:hypothetical protein
MSDPNFNVFLPSIPEYMSWDDWNGTFVIYYGQEPLPILPEDQWREAADQIAALPTFTAYPVPESGRFSTWQEWAREVTTIINGPSR